MPINITLTLADDDLAKLAAALGLGSSPTLTGKTSPKIVSDSKPEKKKGAAPAAAPAPAEEPAADEEPEATTDLATEAQREVAKDTANGADLDEVRSQLIDYYVGQGSSKKEVQNAIAGMSEEELRAAYLDFLARLVSDDTSDFCADYETPYVATRVDDGKNVKRWVAGGVTLTDEQCADKKLADPNAKAAAAKKGPALPKRAK